MAYTITSESYGPRKPFITATATSTDDLTALGTDFAEGSTCVISTTTYKLDKVKGWIDPSQGGGADLPDPSAANDGDVLTVDDGAWVAAAPSGGSGALVVTVTKTGDVYSANKTAGEIINAMPLAYYVAEEDGGVFYESIYGYQVDETGYVFHWNSYALTAATLDDYPSYDDGGQ